MPNALATGTRGSDGVCIARLNAASNSCLDVCLYLPDLLRGTRQRVEQTQSRRSLQRSRGERLHFVTTPQGRGAASLPKVGGACLPPPARCAASARSFAVTMLDNK